MIDDIIIMVFIICLMVSIINVSFYILINKYYLGDILFYDEGVTIRLSKPEEELKKYKYILLKVKRIKEK